MNKAKKLLAAAERLIEKRSGVWGSDNVGELIARAQAEATLELAAELRKLRKKLDQ